LVLVSGRRICVLLSVDAKDIIIDEQCHKADGPNESKEAKDAEVEITGAGGTGYTVQTRRHRLLGSLELDMTSPVTSRLTNWVWSGPAHLVASLVTPTGPFFLVFKVSTHGIFFFLHKGSCISAGTRRYLFLIPVF
jgi:hypothetical protein